MKLVNSDASPLLYIFDMFFVHERGRMISVYLFAQQLGSMYEHLLTLGQKHL